MQPMTLHPLMLVASTLLLLTLTTTSTLTQVNSQYTTAPSPSCPVGYDCVGRELSPYLSQHIDCRSPQYASDFAGFTCNMGEDADGQPTFNECPSGYYCPSPVEKYECPKGSWCHRASLVPEKCLDGDLCGAGSKKQFFLTPFIVTLAVLIAGAFLYYFMHQRINKRVAMIKENRDADKLANANNADNKPTQHAIRIKAMKAFDSHIQPKLNLDFQNVSVSVKDSNADQSQSTSTSTQAGMKNILHNITGTVRGGRLTAVMGPSGSGKTTFLNALLNKIPISSGKILINHQHSVEEVIKMNIVGYVPQADIMLSMLTVRDLISHSAYMRLPGTMTREIKLQRIDAVMELLGITEIADSIVGDDMNRGISGGQKKRVSIAMELVADPLILFLDEPTSGLDSAAAQQVCDGLLSIAQQSRVVCCVIHQPRWEIFSKFEDVLLLGKGGIVIYFGPVANIRDHFASMGYVPPANTNPADFYLDTISEDDFLTAFKSLGYEGMVMKATSEGKARGKKGDAAAVRIHYDDSIETRTELEANMDGASKSNLLVVDEEKFDGDVSHQGSISVNQSPVVKTLAVPSATANKISSYTSHTPIIPIQSASVWTQFWVLLYRNLLVDCRNAKYVAIDCFLQILPAAGLGIDVLGKDNFYPALPQVVADTCIGMVNDRCQDELTLNTFTVPPFYYTMIIAVGAMMWATNTFGRPQSIFFRDRVAGQSTLAYFLAKIVYDLGHMLRMLFIFMSIFFLMRGPRGGYGYWLLVCGMTFYASMGVAYFVSIVVPYSRATMIGIVCAITFSVTSGLSPSMNVVSNWNILRVFWYVSYNRWASEAFIILDTSNTGAQGRLDHVIDAAGYNSDNLGLDIGLVFLIGCAWRVLSYYALLKSKPRTEF